MPRCARLLLAILVLLQLPLLTLPLAQSSRGPFVTATLESGVVRLGETTTVTIAAVGSRDATLVTIPTVEGLTFGRAQQGLYQSFSNGRARVEVRFELSLRAVEEGDYTIPGFVLSLNGKQMETRPLGLRVVRDLKGEDLGFLEVRPSATRVVEGQPLTIELTVGIDENMNFLQPILPWWGELPGTVPLEGRPQSPGSSSVELQVSGRYKVQAESVGLQQRDGKTFQVYRLERRVLPVRSGTLEIGMSHAEFGRLGQQRGFLSSRSRKIDSYFVYADAFDVEVLPLPSEGQPVDFGGAVGNISVRARTDTRDVLVGDSIKLTVEWEGEGNLEFFDPPDLGLLDAFRNFRAYGKTEEKNADRRRVTYDIAPQSEDAVEIPPVSLTVYDPFEGRYVNLATDAIPIRVRPLEGVGALSGESVLETTRDILDLDDRPLSEGRSAPRAVPGDAFVAGTLFGMPLLLLGLRTVVRRRAGDPSRPALRRRRRAQASLRSQLRGDFAPEVGLAAMAEFLGARTEESNAAWEGRKARDWSAALPQSQRLPSAAVDHLDAVLLRLEAAVFGGGKPVPAAEILEAARAIQEAGL